MQHKPSLYISQNAINKKINARTLDPSAPYPRNESQQY